MKISATVEQVFAHAVALEQSGGLRNTIYAIGSRIYILNYDHTVLIRFRLRKSEAPFEHPVSFRANDYDSNEFYEEDGRIVFASQDSGYTRVKKCGTPDLQPEQVKDLFKKLDEVDRADFVPLSLDKNVLNLLDRTLSHTELIGDKGKSLKMVQRNVYSGTILEVEKTKGTMGLLSENDVLSDDIEPIAIKTNDLAALFVFQDVLTFYLPKKGLGDYIIVESVNKQKRDMSCIIACCIYDEIIAVKESYHGINNKDSTSIAKTAPAIVNTMHRK